MQEESINVEGVSEKILHAIHLITYHSITNKRIAQKLSVANLRNINEENFTIIQMNRPTMI